ncbi:hypothetical protein G210_4979 [Candida maltosa Xu316]|uniref:F-box domain-containing protein n=1 Tax=Candida maltosa (strain Xu316) TaxID=1245528 RepID=M3ITT9_CANMX|nr:hypothetical protein G210_4979 [Candida maltosa Xu316]
MTTQLLDLPTELLAIVFSYLPGTYLKKLTDVPQVKYLAIDALYSSIHFGWEKPSHLGYYDAIIKIEEVGKEFEPDVYGTDLEDPLQFAKEVVSKKIPKPKVIYFEKFKDLYEVSEYDSTILQDVKIGFTIDDFKKYGITDSRNIILENEVIQKGYQIQKLYQLPSQWVLDYYFIDDEGYPEALTYGRRFLSYVFPNLSELTISKAIPKDVLKYLPQSLSILGCCVESSDIDTDEELEFPEQLHHLILTLQDGAVTYNLQRIKYLQKLSVIHGCKNHRFLLPPNLKEFLSIWGYVQIGEILQQCPYLTSICCEKFVGCRIVTADGLLGESQVHRLELPQHEFFAPNQDFALLLPPTLTHLIINGYVPKIQFRPPQDVVILDFNTNRLDNLQSLVLNEIQNLKLIGTLPVSLTKLTYHVHAEFRFEWVEDLPNLTKLSIKYGLSPSYSILKCGSQLEFLEIGYCYLHQAHIVASKLKYLNLSHNSFSTISTRKITIPEGVIELDLSYNRMRKIDSGFQFPSQLYKLALDGNGISDLPELPSHLKEFSCFNNAERIKWKNKLPTSLEKLNLNGDHINDEELQMLDLKRLNNLKRLGLSKNIIWTINVDDFPTSLTHLFLFENYIATIHGNFSTLNNLVMLDVSDNQLGHYINYGSKQVPEVFGTNIRYLNTNNNNKVITQSQPTFLTSSFRRLKSTLWNYMS